MHFVILTRLNIQAGLTKHEDLLELLRFNLQLDLY
ncbi:MAG: hypothetical protein K0S91_657 [Nitrososphaeraceae archaeon]|nr:hypothetical protein [Nitrososphaeraceae archaeon]